MSLPKAFTTSNRQDWATPWPFVEEVEKQLGLKFTLDVCAADVSAKAPAYYTEEQNAFNQNWHADSGRGDIWCNPPYGHKRFPVYKWVRDARIYSANCTDPLNIVLLLPINKMDQPWFHDTAVPNAEIWIVKGRIGFLDPETGKKCSGNSQGSMLLHFGPKATPGKINSFVWR